MSQALQMRRTYTTTRQNEDDSVFVSSATSTSESEKSTYASEEKSSGNIVKNTSNTEVGRPTKKSKTEQSSQKTTALDTSPKSEYENKIIEFFKKLENHKDPKKSKKDLVEEFIRSNASEAFMRDMTKIANEEIVRLKGNKAAKWLSIFESGSLSQNTSFFLASEIAMAIKQPWLFPVLATIFSEGLSDKVAALTRRTTFVTNDAKNLFRKQRLIARAIGDMVRQCGGLKPAAKYRSNNPAHKGQKFTAWDALWNDSDRFLAVSAHNLVNRGVPFLCFTGTYLLRDFLAQVILKGAPGWQTLLLRWGSGVTAGGLTALSSQIITANNKDATEAPGYSTSYWHARETYLHSVRQDIRDRLNEVDKSTDPALRTRLEKFLLDLDKKIQREIGVAGLKKSILTAIPGEIKASAHRSRPEDSLDPEVPGTLAQSIHSACGKFISLIYFTYMLDQAMKSDNGTESFSSFTALNFVFLNFALVMMGWMWKDDLQIVSRTGHALAKSMKDVTTGRAAYQEKTRQPLTDVTTQIPDQVYNDNNIENENENDADNRVASSPKNKFADESSGEKLTDREREARDRKREREKKEEASSGSDKVVEVSSSSASATKTYDYDDYSSSEDSPAPKRKRQS